MEQNKDELGEFFRMSMESFQDSPSDAVWQNIDSRLAAEVTVWSTILSFITKYFLVFLLGSTLVTYLFYTQYKYNRLTNEVGIIKEQFETLEVDYSKMNTQYSELLIEQNKSEKHVQSLRGAIDEQNLQIQSFENRIQNLRNKNAALSNQYNDLSYTLEENRNSRNSYQNLSGGNGFVSNNTFAGSNDQSNKDQGLVDTQKLDGRDISLLEEDNVNTKMDGQNDFSHVIGSKSRSGEKPSLANAAGNSIAVAKIRRGFDWDNKTRAYQNSVQRYVDSKMGQLKAQKISPNKIEVADSKFNPFKYGYGFNLSTINVITNSSDKVNLGLSIGFLHEYKFLEKWSLSNGASINLTTYQIENKADVLTAMDLADVPGGLNFQDAIQDVHVESQYMDFSIGVIRRFHNKEGGGAWFINPSVAWQLYFPQEYLYAFVDGTKRVYDSKRFIGYFGTAKIKIGYEVPHRENLHFKFGVYGERSFVEQGKELRHRVNVGLSGSVLFGK